MTKDELITEVTNFIKETIEETDGSVDLQAAGPEIGEFVQDLESDEEAAEDEEDGEGSSDEADKK